MLFIAESFILYICTSQKVELPNGLVKIHFSNPPLIDLGCHKFNENAHFFIKSKHIPSTLTTNQETSEAEQELLGFTCS